MSATDLTLNSAPQPCRLCRISSSLRWQISSSTRCCSRSRSSSAASISQSSPNALFFNLCFPVLVLLLYGFIWGNEPGGYFSQDFGYIDMMVPALAGLIIATVAFMTIPVAPASAREQKLLRRYQVTPLRPIVYFTADVSVYFSVALVGVAFLILAAKLFFGLRFDGNWLAVLAGFTLSLLAFISLGYIIASLAPTSKLAQIVGMVVFFPMMFLSGMTIPLMIMPPGVQEFANWLPLTHVVYLLQDIWLDGAWNSLSGLILLGVLAVGTAVSTATFRWE